jgi:hypothetical protein
MKKAVFWDVAPCRCGANRRFGGKYRLHLQSRRKNIRKSASEERVRTGASGATSQKTAFFIVTAVKTSNLTQPLIVSQIVLMANTTIRT